MSSEAAQQEAPKRIMACVDGSKTGYRAAEFAINLALKLGATVFFANVVGASTSDRNYSIPADMVGSFEVLGAEALSKCEEMAEMKGAAYEKLQLSGDPADQILKECKEIKCDCIVIGRMGLGRLERLLLGSVSEKVLNLAEVPVVIVK